NERQDGLMLATGDVIYTAVTQPAYTRMNITLDVLAGSVSNADFDIFMSTQTAYPDSANWQWKGVHANTTNDLTTAGEPVDLGTYGSSSRTVYIAIPSYRGAGHFIIRANVAKTAGGVKNLRICHPGISDIRTQPGWTQMKRTIQRTFMRMLQA